MWLSKGTNIRLAGAGDRSLHLDDKAQFFGITGQQIGHLTGQVGLVTSSPGVLTTGISLATSSGVLSIVGTTDLYSQILLVPNNQYTALTISRSKAALSLSITANLKEPSIKDVTSTLSIIDSTDVQVSTRIETEVI